MSPEIDTSGAYVIVPAYNEARVIRATVTAVHALFAHVVVVDDCSRDDTGAEALAAGAVVLRHPVNLGQGAALQTGIDHALAAGAEAIITFDADGQHDIADAVRMLRVLRES